MLLRFLQPLKTPAPIKLIFSGRRILVKLEQPRKAYCSIRSTVLGMLMSVRFLQELKSPLASTLPTAPPDLLPAAGRNRKDSRTNNATTQILRYAQNDKRGQPMPKTMWHFQVWVKPSETTLAKRTRTRIPFPQGAACRI